MKKLIVVVCLLSTMLFSCKKDNSVTPIPSPTLSEFLSGHNISTQFFEDVYPSSIETSTPVFRDSLSFPSNLNGQFTFRYTSDVSVMCVNYLGRISCNELIFYNLSNPNIEVDRWKFQIDPRQGNSFEHINLISNGVQNGTRFIVAKRN